MKQTLNYKINYIRFVVGSDNDDHRKLTGIITESQILISNTRLEEYEVKCIEEIFDWFNCNLKVPTYSQNKKLINSAAYFKETATKHINKMWDLVHFLKENNKQVKILKSKNPGEILYEDEYQIVVREYKNI